MGRSEHTDMLAIWRRNEQMLEAGLDPELAKRLDDLRVEDARSMQRSPRLYPIRVVDAAQPPSPQILRRTG